MATRTETVNGKKVKLYPAFNTEAHAHDIEYRRNKLSNEMVDLRDELTADEMEQMEKLEDQLTEILERITFPMTYLPWELYCVARDTIGWAATMR